jgi:transposase
VVVTPLVRFFTVTLSRSKAAAQQILGEDFDGYLGSDRYSSYSWLDPRRRQVCWAHLLRDFQAIAERSGASREIGKALLRRGYRLFHWWHRVRDGTLSQQLFLEAVVHLRVAFVAELESAANLEIAPKEKTPLAKTVRTCAKILELEVALWTFVYVLGVEPTNNGSEQALRPAVIWQYTSFGSQSKAGSEFVERMLTVSATLKAQNRSLLELYQTGCRSGEGYFSNKFQTAVRIKVSSSEF